MESKYYYLRTSLIFACCIFIPSTTIYSLINLLTSRDGFGIGIQCFRYFTIESNILMSITSLITLAFITLNMKSKAYIVPFWLSLLLLASTSAVMLTLITVVVFLGPTMGYELMFTGGNLFMHLLNPLVALFLYTSLLNKPYYKKKWFFIGFVPTFIYGLIYVICVFGLKIWNDFYNFNLNGLWFLIFPLMILGSNLISFGIYSLRNLISATKKE